MELKAYARIIGKSGKFVAAAAVFFAAGLFLLSYYLPPTYTASLTIYVKRRSTEPSGSYYTFDGYYSQQAAEKFTETVVGFLKSKDILYAAAKLALWPTDQRGLERLEGSLKIKETAPQLVNLTVTQGDPDNAKKISVALAQAATERINLLNQTGDKDISVDLLNPEPLIKKNQPPLWLNTAVGGLLGGSLALALIFLREYLS